MIIGANTVYEHGGKPYHIQAEDLGLEQASLEIRVYDGGNLLWQKRVPYGNEVDTGLPKAQCEEQVARLMEKAMQTVRAAIARGKIG